MKKRIVPDGYLYPNRKEFMEEMADEIRAALARVSQESKASFMSELTTMVLAE